MRTLSRFIGGEAEVCLRHVSEMFLDRQPDAVQSDAQNEASSSPGGGKHMGASRPSFQGGFGFICSKEQNEVACFRWSFAKKRLHTNV